MPNIAKSCPSLVRGFNLQALDLFSEGIKISQWALIIL